MNALQIHGLRAGYAGVSVLRGVDLSVRGGVTAILGSSGCGKTTLLRAVAGFVTPSAGTIDVAGTRMVGAGRIVPARSRGIGYVPQEGALFPHLNVARNVTFGLPRAGRGSSGDTVAEMLALVELDPALAGRFPHELSGGQQQRVALARALAPRPNLVLLDEPFSSLDAGLREETGRSVVRALRAAGAAALLVTHDQGEALSLADQVAVMVDGQFLQVAAPSTVYLSPADPRVAAFLGHATMLDGTVTSTGRGRCALGEVAVDSSLAVGEIRFAVRSEQVQVHPEPAAGLPQGTVLDASFFGHDATVRITLDSGESVSARTPSGAVPDPGDRVGVSVLGDVIGFR